MGEWIVLAQNETQISTFVIDIVAYFFINMFLLSTSVASQILAYKYGSRELSLKKSWNSKVSVEVGQFVALNFFQCRL